LPDPYIDPATEEELGTVPEMGLKETQEAIDAAGETFLTWGKTTAKERHDILVKFYNLMQENSEDLARIIVGPYGWNPVSLAHLNLQYVRLWKTVSR
jgi:acyl-CoA reductase-like NAD-dependent aldehyde dehydrogenase